MTDSTALHPISIIAHVNAHSRTDPVHRGVDAEHTFSALNEMEQMRERLIASDILNAIKRHGYLVVKRKDAKK